MSYDFWVRTKQDLVDAVNTYGIVPYFSTSIPGFSLEEHCSPYILFVLVGIRGPNTQISRRPEV